MLPFGFGRVIGSNSPRHSIALHSRTSTGTQRLRCPDAELVHADVLDYEIPDGVTVAFLYNPFQEKIFATVVERLLQSVERNPRTLRIIYEPP